jgi:hypothetical protein
MTPDDLLNLCKEVLKASFVRYDRIRRQRKVGSEAQAHAFSALALSLGYATSQSFLFMIIVTAILENNGGESDKKVWIWVERRHTHILDVLHVQFMLSCCVSTPLVHDHRTLSLRSLYICILYLVFS